MYSSLDQTARKINISKFRNKKAMVLLVTDVAARGLDIPMLDNVVNYNFPSKSKLFVHRVGEWPCSEKRINNGTSCVKPGSQTSGPHVARESMLCGPRCVSGIFV